MAKRIFIHHSKSNHCQSVNPQFGTQFGTWISHFGLIDFSNSYFESLHSCTLQLSQVDLKWSCRLTISWGAFSNLRHILMVNLLCICQKLIFGRFFFWQKPKFLAGHYWKHCHTLDLCCVNSVHRMFDHRLCSKCISRIATFVFVSSDCSTISCDYPWSFCWTYLGYLISKTATLILIAPINSNHVK